jgi:hypothetical protein
MLRYFFFFFVLIAVHQVAAIGIGVSPSVISIENLLAGSEHTIVMTLTNPSTTSIRVTPSTESLERLLRFQPPSLTIAPEGIEEVRLTISVPRTGAPRSYQSRLHFEAEASADSAVGIIPGATTEILFSATNERMISGSVDNIRTRDVSQGDPIPIYIGFVNTGNVEVEPQARIDLRTLSGEPIVLLESPLQAVEPRRSAELIAWLDPLEIGSYRAQVELVLGSQTLADKELTFNVFEPGKLSRIQGLKNTETPAGADPLVGMLTMAGLLIAGIGVFFFLKRRQYR